MASLGCALRLSSWLSLPSGPWLLPFLLVSSLTSAVRPNAQVCARKGLYFCWALRHAVTAHWFLLHCQHTEENLLTLLSSAPLTVPVLFFLNKWIQDRCSVFDAFTLILSRLTCLTSWRLRLFSVATAFRYMKEILSRFCNICKLQCSWSTINCDIHEESGLVFWFKLTVFLPYDLPKSRRENDLSQVSVETLLPIPFFHFSYPLISRLLWN